MTLATLSYLAAVGALAYFADWGYRFLRPELRALRWIYWAAVVALFALGHHTIGFGVLWFTACLWALLRFEEWVRRPP